ncbi:MAG: hypothetical protein ABL986_13280 [Vicinamibacterales bacterium]
MRIVATLIVFVALIGPAYAEEPNVTPAPDAEVIIAQRLKPVFVTLDTGETVSGPLLDATSRSLTLLVDRQPVTVPFEHVRQVQRTGDSVRNGARIGALAFGLWCAYICRQSVPGIWPYAVVTNSLVGAALGAGIDAGIPGRSTIYVAPPKTECPVEGPRPMARLSFRF